MTERGIPLDRQFRNWSELNVQPFDTRAVHPYTRARVILMNGIEVEAVMNSHQTARRTLDIGLKQRLAQVRRAEQHQQKAINWLVPHDESVIANTLGYEQVAVDLTAWVARHEPDPYLTQVYEFGLLEDFDHLYRYANLMDLEGEHRRVEEIVGDLTEVLPGRPTIFQHRDPLDELRRPMTKEAAHPQSILNALTVLAAEQQTMNFYMVSGNRPMSAVGRGLYAEIAMIEEQHVTHYESIIDPSLSWMENLVLHEWNECWLYWSCVETEVDPRIKAIWELHLAMEIEHLRIAVELLQTIEGKDVRELLPSTSFAEPMRFHENKAYVRDVLARTVDWTGWDSQFTPVETLPTDHRFHAWQATVNAGGTPSEDVIAKRRADGGEIRLSTEGPHPVAGLEDDGRADGATYARALAAGR